MASATIFTSLRRRGTPYLEAFLMPVDLTESALLDNLTSLSSELISTFSSKTARFQRRNSRSLLRKIEVFSVLVESLRDAKVTILPLPRTVLVCLKELYLALYRSKFLLEYCNSCSTLWLLLQIHPISGQFHDLSQQFYTLMDCFPLYTLNLPQDVKEQVELLRKQSRKTKLFIADTSIELLRLKMYSFLNDFETGKIPDESALHTVIVEKMGIKDAKICGLEIEFLEEQILNFGESGDLEPNGLMLNGFVALMRYCRFLLYGFEDDEVEIKINKCMKLKNKGFMVQEIAETLSKTFVKIPKDFCCPITLELMNDPVVVWTGQTYDRVSITRWIDEGHYTCPKTGQTLQHKWLVPNRGLRNLITQWCIANKIQYDPLEHGNPSNENFTALFQTKAAIEANKATVRLLIHQLAKGTVSAKTNAAKEIRLLAKNGKENRAYIAEAGAIPYLNKLLSSQNSIAQENSVTAMLNLSIHDKNKTQIMNEETCLVSIIKVLRFGHTIESRENAAATLFSLSAVHDYKKRIADENGAIEALANMLSSGTPRGKKDAVTALFNLSTHMENCVRMVDSGGLKALVNALECEIVAEEAAGALALIVRQVYGAEAMKNEEKGVSSLIEMMRSGSPRGKENAVSALLEYCRSGGEGVTENVLKVPSIAVLLQSLLFTGTKRARRKAASLARVFQRCENSRYGGLSYSYSNASLGVDYPMSFSMSMQVPVV